LDSFSTSNAISLTGSQRSSDDQDFRRSDHRILGHQRIHRSDDAKGENISDTDDLGLGVVRPDRRLRFRQRVPQQAE
jgi:hypothetical protein